MNLHRGTKYECPICGFRSDGWATVGIDVPVLKEKNVTGAGRRNAGCYRCDSDDRERLIYVYLRDRLKMFAGDYKNVSLLHIAPEPGLERKLSELELKKYVCGDLFSDGYNYPENVVSMDVQRLPFEDESFDLILCNHVLEHVEDDVQAMSELCRVLNSEGTAILQVPVSASLELTREDKSVTGTEERMRLFGQSDHVRLYGQDYPARLQQCGFNVERINISKEYSRYGLNPEEDLFICKKPKVNHV